jgi:hypothetical protein
MLCGRLDVRWPGVQPPQGALRCYPKPDNTWGTSQWKRINRRSPALRFWKHLLASFHPLFSSRPHTSRPSLSLNQRPNPAESCLSSHNRHITVHTTAPSTCVSPDLPAALSWHLPAYNACTVLTPPTTPTWRSASSSATLAQSRAVMAA